MPLQPGADFDLPAYLARIGFAGTPAPDARTLHEICRLHPLAIPFENLTPLLGRPVSLEIGDLQAKIIAGRRGGYCYEHNTLLAHALDAAGFGVTGMAARVLWERPADTVSAQTHMVLRVAAGGEDWIADAGFGGCTLTAPLRIAPDREQPTPHETVRLTRAAGGGGDLILAASIGGAWKPVFQLGLERRYAADYALANYWVSTHLESFFTTSLIVTRPFAGGRRTLRDWRLSEYRPDAPPAHRAIASADELEEIVGGVFGIEIPDRAAFREKAEELPR